MAETPVGVLLRATGSLHNTVEADELADHYPHESDYGTGRARPYRPVPADLMAVQGAELQAAFASQAMGAVTAARRWAGT